MYIQSFTDHLEKEKRMAKNSRDAYRRDIKEFSAFAKGRGLKDASEATNTDVIAWLHELKSAGRSAATVNRKVASVRAYFKYLIGQNIVREDPTNNIRSPKIWNRRENG